LTPRRLQQLWYVPLLGFAMLLMLVRLLAMARLLDTHGFGQYSAGLLVSSTFCMLACLGLQPVLYRELPVMMVRGRVRPGAVLLAQCIVIACACAGVLMLAALAGLSLAGLSPGLLLVALFHGWSQQVFILACADSRSRGEPLAFAQESLVRAVATLGAGAVVAVTTGAPAWTLLAEGLISALLAQVSLASMFRRVGMPAALVYRLALRRLPRVQWRAPLALFVLGVVSFTIMSLDRWIAAQWLTPARFAQYAFAWTVLMVAQSAQLLVNASVFPLLARRYGRLGLGPTYRTCARVSWGLLACGALLGVPSWLLLEAGVGRWYPDYRAAAELIPLFLFVAVLRVSDYWSSFMIIAGFEARLLIANLSASVAAGLIWLLWVRASTEPDLSLSEIGLLAALLTAISYLVTLAAAWRAARS
jgi:O-antigen/teichoic acid export membrane protein